MKLNCKTKQTLYTYTVDLNSESGIQTDIFPLKFKYDNGLSEY